MRICESVPPITDLSTLVPAAKLPENMIDSLLETVILLLGSKR